MHSVTGISPNDLQWDSDPGTDAPEHQAGDEYIVQFDQPGELPLPVQDARLRPRQGDRLRPSRANPDSSFGPGAAAERIDLTPPTLGDVKLRRTKISGSEGGADEGLDLRRRHPRRRVLPPRLEGPPRLQRLPRMGAPSSASTTSAWRRAGSTSRPGRAATSRSCGRPTRSNNTSKPVTKAFTIGVAPDPAPRRRPAKRR